MFKNKSEGGRLNISGQRIAEMRTELGLSQRALADRLQLMGLELNKNAVQRLESGQRFITDIELAAFAEFFRISADRLLGGD